MPKSQSDDDRSIVVIDEPLRDLIPLAIARPCEKCKEPTRWMRKGQRTKGVCLVGCIAGEWRFIASPLLQETVVLDLVDAFPGSTVVGAPPAKPWYVPGAYAQWVLRWAVATHVRSGYQVKVDFWGLPADAGPCSICSGVICRYGPNGRPMCSACATKKGVCK